MEKISSHSTASPNSSADAAAWLAAIIDDSQDAILSKTLDGIITSWNAGAERLFGFWREEAIGKPITIIIPEDRLHEEADIISRLRNGERIERFETVRKMRDGTPVPIEVTISPVRNSNGEIIGASKIARDIKERLQHAQAQSLLVREMQHRIKNILSIVQGLVVVGGRRAHDIGGFVDDLTARIASLAAVQQLVLPKERPADGDDKPITLGMLLAAVMAPYLDDRVRVADCEAPVAERALTSLALLFHELATNAVKYGALSNPHGILHVSISIDGDTVSILWREEGGNQPAEMQEGFGSELLRAALRGLRGSIQKDWVDGAFDTFIAFPKAGVLA